jgi:filamentous hemagglutinin
MNKYQLNLGSGAKWFGGAEFVSRAPWTGLGADGNFSYLTFAVGALFAGTHASDIYEWRSVAGNTLMNSGFDSFKDLYNSGTADPIVWDINQLRAEQQVLQPIHEKYLSDRVVFTIASKLITNTDYAVGAKLEKQGQPGGVDILDYKSRVQYGCKLLDYSANQGCKP